MRTPQVTFFTRRNCPLCDAALSGLRGALHGMEYALREVDIDDEPRYFERYDEHVPVVWVDGVETCRHRLEPEKLLSAVGALK
jgi:glutaredoxin